MVMKGERTAREVADASGEELMQMVFAHIGASKELSEFFDCTYKFLLHGNRGGVWLLKGGDSPSLSTGLGTADCTIECSTETLGCMILGISNPQAEYLKGELKVSGDTDRALRIVRLWER